MGFRGELLMKALVVLLVLLSPSVAYACSCAGTEDGVLPPLTVHPVQLRVVVARTIPWPAMDAGTWKNLADAPFAIDVEVIEVIKGSETRRVVRIGGISSCNSRLDGFAPGSRWLLGLELRRKRSWQRRLNLPDWDYELDKCTVSAVADTKRLPEFSAATAISLPDGGTTDFGNATFDSLEPALWNATDAGELMIGSQHVQLVEPKSGVEGAVGGVIISRRGTQLPWSSGGKKLDLSDMYGVVDLFRSIAQREGGLTLHPAPDPELTGLDLLRYLEVAQDAEVTRINLALRHPPRPVPEETQRSIMSALDSHSEEVRACYRSARFVTPVGRVLVAFLVSATGKVHMVKQAGPKNVPQGRYDPSVANCLEDAVKAWHLPPFKLNDDGPILAHHWFALGPLAQDGGVDAH